jgi:phosphatidylglycerol:prolipoprotein diacylglycerol transferase
VRPTIDLYWIELPLYTALVGLGIAVGLFTAYLYLRARSRRLSRLDLFLDGALLALAAGWIGARAYHVMMRWDYYQIRPEEIAPLSGIGEGNMPGGLGMRGALLLGLAAVALYAAARRLSFWHLSDAAALGLAVGQAIGWAGALAQGANYGIVSDSRLAIELPDLYGLIAPRFPLQHVEILLYAAVFLVLVALAAQNRSPGTLFFVYLVAVSLSNAALGFQRGDETAYWGVLRIDQIVDAAVAAVALAGWLGRWWAAQRVASRSVQELEQQINV